MGHGSLCGKRDRVAFVSRRVCGAVTIRFSSLSITDSLPLVAVPAIIPVGDALAAGLAMLLLALAIRGFVRLRATTLAAPCAWVALSAISLAVSAAVEHRFQGIGLSALRFATAATTFCPLMAVLGAKRPQDRGWQWVVLTLWVILVWPAAQAALLPAGVRLELFIAWKLFLWGLILLGLLNYLPTRHWGAAILVAYGQFLLLNEHVGFLVDLSAENRHSLALLAFVVAAGWVSAFRFKTFNRSDSRAVTLSSKWLDFRNSFGAFWALRALGRINQSAEVRDWPIRLTWSGFVESDDQQPTEQHWAEIGQSLDSMLRRFVDLGEQDAIDD